MPVTLWKYNIHKAEDGPKAEKINVIRAPLRKGPRCRGRQGMAGDNKIH